jgi:hypothetical protein
VAATDCDGDGFISASEVEMVFTTSKLNRLVQLAALRAA